MRRIEFDQGSKEWLKWRQGLLTATDAPMLLGVSPYATPYKGWQRKLGLIPEQVETEPMRRGKRDEPIARDWFIKEYGIQMEPWCVERDEFNFIGASLDGLSPCGKYLLEIKSNGDQYHFGLNSGPPEFHYCQMQHQYLACDNIPEMCFYLSWNKSGPKVLEIKLDKVWMDDYIPKAREFWRKIALFDAPDMTNKDYKDMNEAKHWKSYAYEYRKACEQIRNLEKIKESYRDEIVKLCGEDSCFGGGIKVLKKMNKGRIDYESIPELACVDLEKYRKSSSFAWTIMMDKK
jgi:putative phage-type endonuclease